MKNLNLILAVMMALVMQVATAQTQLWGTCMNGGSRDSGTIFMTDGNGNNFHSIYSFNKTTGSIPLGTLCLAPNGKLYGVTRNGGCDDSCVVYSYNPVTGIFNNFHDLFCDDIHGWKANSGMMLAADGNLYGLCSGGGVNDKGVIYKVDPSTDTYTDIYDFDTANVGPQGTLIQLSDGKLYGYTNGNGTQNFGTLFSFDISTSVFTRLHSLYYLTGDWPNYGGLLMATDNKLYGVTSGGGANLRGVIFSYDLSTDTYNDIHDFDSIGGYNPNCIMIQATDGKLYGVTSSGGASIYFGVIFSYDISTHNYTVLHNFDGTFGSYPARSLMQASNGKLYGMTNRGGTNNIGVFYSFDISSNTYSVVMNLDSAIGANPDCDIIETPWITGIPSIPTPSPLTISPNPASQTLNITYNSIAQLIITDMMGNKIYSQPITTINNSIDVSKWSKGVYFVQLRSERENLVKKLVID